MCGESTPGTAGQNAKMSSGTPIHRRAPITHRAKSWSRRKGRTETSWRAPESVPRQSSSPMYGVCQKTRTFETLILMTPLSRYREDQRDRQRRRPHRVSLVDQRDSRLISSSSDQEREVLGLYRKHSGEMGFGYVGMASAKAFLIQRLEGSRPDLAGQLLIGY
jgi:hypothetical protein